MSLGSPNENWVTNRAAEALATAHADASVHTYSDTFADVDCGYFPHCGVVNRLYNQRTGFHILRHLNAALAAAGIGNWDFHNGDQETRRSNADGDGHLVNLKTGERRTGDASNLSQTDSPTIWIA